jgi:glycosyltransferase involved in cell wall biosynthesis
MISFIIPAHNEEALIVRTINAIHHSAKTTAEDYEIIVVDDASTDATAQLARANGATVVSVAHRQIARTRNSGGHAARGDRLFFIDADTTATPAAVAAALRAIDQGAVGGGAVVRVEPPCPLYIRLLMAVFYIPAKLAGFCGGAFMFCTRNAFQQSGGFDETMFWAEEGVFTLRLKRLGRFTIIWPRVLTSGRRLHTISLRQAIPFARGLLRGKKVFTSREPVNGIWYNSNRSNDIGSAISWPRRLANGLLFLIAISLITGPIWNFIPWTYTPMETPLGKFRFVNRIFLCHAGLILWPFSFALFRNLLRQALSMEWIRLSVLTLLCSWQALLCTRAVFKIWTRLFQWAAT